MLKNLKFMVLLIILSFLTTQPVFGQWPTTPDQRLTLGYGTETKIVSGSDGGIFTVFKSSTGVMQSSCYLQKTDEYGNSLLPYPIHLDCGNGIFVEDYQVVTDGEGGVIIGVLERCGEDPNWFWKISMYRFDSNGEIIYWNLSANLSGEVVPQDYFVLFNNRAEVKPQLYL